MALRVLHVSKSSSAGGAAKAAQRLHEAERSIGLDSWMYSDEGTYSNPYQLYPSTWFQKKQQVFYARLERWHQKHVLKQNIQIFSHGYGSDNLARIVKVLKPDIIHIHWPNRGVIGLNSLAKLDVPILWTLHDKWIYTGGCHYSAECNRYKHGCGSCPLLKKTGTNDVSKTLLEKKVDAVQGNRIVFAGPSSWIVNDFNQSSLAEKTSKQAYHVFNPLDLRLYYRRDTEPARRTLGLPLGRPLVLFGAFGGVADSRKGFDLLLDSLNWLVKFGVDLELVVLGTSSQIASPFKVHYLPYAKSDEEMATIYSAVNMYVVPSREDNSPNTIIESLACGTPVAGFDIGGLPDLVIQGKTGYLAPPFNTEALAKAIALTLAQSGVLSHHAEQFAQKELSYSTIAGKYHRLYHQLLS